MNQSSVKTSKYTQEFDELAGCGRKCNGKKIIVYEIEHTNIILFYSQRSLLEELCPSANAEDIDAALSASGGEANVAAQSLLGMYW